MLILQGFLRINHVVGWARAEGRLTKQCFCYFTSTAPQRESFFFFARFASVKPLFLPFFVVFVVLVLVGGVGGWVGGVRGGGGGCDNVLST